VFVICTENQAQDHVSVLVSLKIRRATGAPAGARAKAQIDQAVADRDIVSKTKRSAGMKSFSPRQSGQCLAVRTMLESRMGPMRSMAGSTQTVTMRRSNLIIMDVEMRSSGLETPAGSAG
jgi:hypothetical protein